MINFDYKAGTEILNVTSDGITFSSTMKVQGMDIIFHDNISLNESPWDDDMRSIIAEIKSRIKNQKKKEVISLESKLKSFGDIDLGRDYYPCRLDKRLLAAMRSQGVVITKFINEAIAEKLTKDFGTDI